MGTSIINLYKQFDKYKYVSNDTIYYKILPSLRLNQYKTDHKTYFYNWAYLNDKAEKEYIDTGHIQCFNWKSGNNLWLAEFVAPYGQTGYMVRNMRHFIKKTYGKDIKGFWYRSAKKKVGYAKS